MAPNKGRGQVRYYVLSLAIGFDYIYFLVSFVLCLTYIFFHRCDMEVVLVVNHVRVNNEQRFGIAMTDELKAEFEQYWQKYESEPLKGVNTYNFAG